MNWLMQVQKSARADHVHTVSPESRLPTYIIAICVSLAGPGTVKRDWLRKWRPCHAQKIPGHLNFLGVGGVHARLIGHDRVYITLPWYYYLLSYIH
jgi:hypothetical protein